MRVKTISSSANSGKYLDAARAQDNPMHLVNSDYELLINSIKDYTIIMLSPRGKIKSWNPAAELIKGYKAAEIIGKYHDICYTEEDVLNEKPARHLEIAATEGRVEDEGWSVRKDGSLYWGNVIITAIKNKDGELIGFTKVTRDLTERKQAEEKLKAAEERFRLLVDAVKDYAIFMLNPDGTIATWNNGARRIKGYRPDEIIGQHFSIFYPPEKQALKYPDYELKVAAEEGRFEEESWRIRKDGTKFWANVVITAVFNSENKLIGFSKVTRDLTERRQVEEKLRFLNENLERLVEERTRELQEAIAQAENASQKKTEFLAMMSHELRNPLNSVIGYTNMTLQGYVGAVTPKQKQYLGYVNSSAQHLLTVINDLLDITKIEKGKLNVKIEDVDLPQIMSEIRPAIAAMSNPHHVTVEYDIAPDITSIKTDPARFKQIMINLVTNAFKYNKPGGSVTIKMSVDPDWFSVWIIDTGIGIAEDELENVFQPFYQVNSSLSRPVEGSGLGLSITKHLVDLHGGLLEVESELGCGTTVKFCLPVHDPDAL